MPLLQTKVNQSDMALLERYQLSLKFPTSKAAIVRTALREWLGTNLQESVHVPDLPVSRTPRVE